MPGIAYREITSQEIGGGDSGNLNRLLQEMVEEINRLGGLNGPIEIFDQLRMKGNRICDVGEPESDTDVATKSSASSDAVSATQTAMEITGNSQLQGIRRLNDDNQRERKSTYLNEIGSTPPNSNDSTVTIGTGDPALITVSAGTAITADQSTVRYAERQVSKDRPPSPDDDFYYFYLRLSDKTLQFIGPFDEDTSENSFGAQIDGRQFIALAKVNFDPGGGGDGGGGGGTGGGGQGGCAEVGSVLMVQPGSPAHMTVENCHEWVEIDLEDGHRVSVHPMTLISVFKRAEDLDVGDLVETESGKYNPIDSVKLVERDSQKMNVHIPNGSTYHANGIRMHNTKVPR